MPEELNPENLTAKPGRRRVKSAVAKIGKRKKPAYPDAETAPEDPIRKIRSEASSKGSSQIAAEVFPAIMGLAVMFVAAVILVASFISIGINKFAMNFSNGAMCCQNSYTAPLARNIIYSIDKKIYALGEEIRAEIINNSDKSIYLAPCQYFNEFQKKIGSGWQARAVAPCDSFPKQISGEFEKVPEKVEEKISASSLGAGIWRGVSNIYFDCRQAKAESCGNRQIIYSSEFQIGSKQNDARQISE